MCALCGTLGGTTHWSDETHAGAESLRRHRVRRVALLNRVLAPSGLKVREQGNGGLALVGRTGRTVLVNDLHGLWIAADTIGSSPMDPLDPELLAALDDAGRDAR